MKPHEYSSYKDDNVFKYMYMYDTYVNFKYFLAVVQKMYNTCHCLWPGVLNVSGHLWCPNIVCAAGH